MSNEQIRIDLLGNKFKKYQYGTEKWKELLEESLDEFRAEIDKLEDEMLNVDKDEEKIFNIIDEMNSICQYIANGLFDGFEEEIIPF